MFVLCCVVLCCVVLCCVVLCMICVVCVGAGLAQLVEHSFLAWDGSSKSRRNPHLEMLQRLCNVCNVKYVVESI